MGIIVTISDNPLIDDTTAPLLSHRAVHPAFGSATNLQRYRSKSESPIT
jgi:hypothetical protein